MDARLTVNTAKQVDGWESLGKLSGATSCLVGNDSKDNLQKLNLVMSLRFKT